MANRKTTLSPSQVNATLGSANYYAEFKQPPDAPESENTLKELDGLLFWQILVTEEDGIFVHMYWESKYKFDICRATLSRTMNSQPLNHGHIGTPKSKPKPAWKNIKPITLILTMASIIGAAEIIHNRYDKLFAEPHLLITAVHGDAQAISNEQTLAIIQIANQVKTEHTNVKVTASLIAPKKNKIPLKIEPQDIPEISGNTAFQAKITIPPLEMGDYGIEIYATAKAGSWQFRREFIQKIPLKVWPNTPHSTLNFTKQKDSTIKIVGVIVIGPPAPHGIDCAMDFQKAKNLTFAQIFDLTSSYRSLRWNSVGNDQDAISKLSWSINPIPDGKTRIKLTTYISSVDAEPLNLIENNSKITCQFRKEA
ncbi:hypothetical protein [Pseudomonas sp. PS02303]|uniref:hypothetical protein n=1 Tax=Pseudomonas sp. PS02303 TaxID=2991429 RepID=UPI00249B415A|nr:hypothetical protein [Pseudomonas sp. PS02303]